MSRKGDRTTPFTAAELQRYADAKGDACPRCASAAISGGSFDAGGLDAWRGVSCNDCGAQWIDTFRLISITPSAGGDPQELP